MLLIITKLDMVFLWRYGIMIFHGFTLITILREFSELQTVNQSARFCTRVILYKEITLRTIIYSSFT